ncbi:hypothetical protein [Parageobacillus thermoglucosidasius]|uniref:hypothetical protein n=1 Tax=Parageobacillus thermoglucosidasius TaxID=1426 RepID=UPI0030C6AAB8
MNGFNSLFIFFIHKICLHLTWLCLFLFNNTCLYNLFIPVYTCLRAAGSLGRQGIGDLKHNKIGVNAQQFWGERTTNLGSTHNKIGANAQQFWGENKHFWGENKHFWGVKNTHFWGENKHFWGHSGLYE